MKISDRAGHSQRIRQTWTGKLRAFLSGLAAVTAVALVASLAVTSASEAQAKESTGVTIEIQKSTFKLTQKNPKIRVKISGLATPVSWEGLSSYPGRSDNQQGSDWSSYSGKLPKLRNGTQEIPAKAVMHSGPSGTGLYPGQYLFGIRFEDPTTGEQVQQTQVFAVKGKGTIRITKVRKAGSKVVLAGTSTLLEDTRVSIYVKGKSAKSYKRVAKVWVNGDGYWALKSKKLAAGGRVKVKYRDAYVTSTQSKSRKLPTLS